MDIFLKRFFQNEQIYVNAMNKLNADMISCDHTFKSACNIGYKRAQDGAWINQYNSIFCILNEQGEIINWQFTKSECFDEVKIMFMNIKQRSKDNGLKLICIDNCCITGRTLKGERLLIPSRILILVRRKSARIMSQALSQSERLNIT